MTVTTEQVRRLCAASGVDEIAALSVLERQDGDLLEALLEGMVRDLRVCRQAPGDENARSSLMWRCALWGSRFFQLGRRFSFPALPVREAAVLAASDWEEYAGVLAVLLLALCRREAEGHPAALAALLAELSLPAEPEQLGAAVRRRLEKVPSTKNLLVHTA